MKTVRVEVQGPFRNLGWEGLGYVDDKLVGAFVRETYHEAHDKAARCALYAAGLGATEWERKR